MDFFNGLSPQHLIEWVFYGVLTFSVKSATTSLTDLKNSVAQLNTQLAVVIERISSHEKKLDEHASRINNIERKRKIRI